MAVAILTIDRNGCALWQPDPDLGHLIVTATPQSTGACTAVVEESTPGRVVIWVWALPLAGQTVTVAAGEGAAVHATGSFSDLREHRPA